MSASPRKIAKAVRHSSGGLRYVKALGLLVEGRAQVSMNLTNFRQTPVARVVEMVRREAERYGVGIHHTELVGLVPQEALVDAAVWYLQLDHVRSGADPGEPVERSAGGAEPAAAAQRPSRWKPAFLEDLAAGTPTPGGGSAAAHAGAAGRGAGGMVARLTVGKKKYAAVEARMWEIIEQAEAAAPRADAPPCNDDSAAFEAYIAALRLPKETPEQQAARARPSNRPRWRPSVCRCSVAQKAVEVLRAGRRSGPTGNVNAISDAASGAALARAALTGSSLNVRINCPNSDQSGCPGICWLRSDRLEDRPALEAGTPTKPLPERGNLAH